MDKSINFKQVEQLSKQFASYLQNYLGLKPGSLYSKEKILKVRDRLRELPFLQEKKNVTVTFNENQATINLKMESSSNCW